MTNPEVSPHNSLVDFGNYLRLELNRSEHTRSAYLTDLTDFVSWLTHGQPEQFDARSVTTGDIRTWLAAKGSSGDTPVTLRRKTQSLRAYFRWLQRQRVIKVNPAAELILAKVPRKLPEIIKESDIEHLLERMAQPLAVTESDSDEVRAATEQQEIDRQRAHLIMTMLYSLGLRRAELLAIKDTDINRHSATLVVNGKRNKQRVLPVPESLLAEMHRWQQTRDRLWPYLPSPKPLICGAHGSLSPETVYKIVHTALEPISAGRKSPHILRHTFATAMLNGGANIDTVKEMLGHASLQTTQIYTHVSFAEMRKNYIAAHPRAGNKHKDVTQEPD